MQRSGFLVKLKAGDQYSANHLSVTSQNDEKLGWISVLCFICAGVMIKVPVSEVKEVEFTPNGKMYCAECDNHQEN